MPKWVIKYILFQVIFSLSNRVRVELARERGRGGDRFGGGDRGGFRGRSPPRRGGNPPGRKTNYRIIVENLSSRTSWQVKEESAAGPIRAIPI